MENRALPTFSPGGRGDRNLSLHTSPPIFHSSVKEEGGSTAGSKEQWLQLHAELLSRPLSGEKVKGVLFRGGLGGRYHG